MASRKGQFKKGQSGNPKGKARGTISRTTKLKNAVLDIIENRKDEIPNLDLLELLKIAAKFVPKELKHSGDGLSKVVILWKESTKDGDGTASRVRATHESMASVEGREPI